MPDSTLELHIRIGNREFIGAWVSVEDFLSRYFLMRLFWPEQTLTDFLGLHSTHPLAQVCRTFQKYQLNQRMTIDHTSGSIGNIAFHTRCAFHLMLLDAYGILDDTVINRLKNTGNFWGAMYEIYVISYFLVAGFKIQMEDESDRTKSHCEFSAIHQSGIAYDVEAKSRVRDLSNYSGGDGNNIKMQMEGLLNNALKKDGLNNRVVFGDINIPSGDTSAMQIWADKAFKEINKIYKDARRRGEKFPNAFFIFTNYPERNAHVIENFCPPFMIAHRVADIPHSLNDEAREECLCAPFKNIQQAFLDLSTVPRDFDSLEKFGVEAWFQ